MLNSIVLIFKRDLKSYAKSPMFLILLAASSLIWEFTFLRTVIGFSKASIQAATNPSMVTNIHQSLVLPHISWVNIMLIFLVPLLTMRIVAEQKKENSFLLLMTAPIHSYQITLGKFFATYISVVSFIGLSFLYPFVLSFMADVHFSTLLCAYLGLFLMGGVYTSIGLFTSSLTTSSTLSAMLAILINLALFLVNGLAVGVENKWLSAFLTNLEVVTHFWKFLSGNFVLGSFVYLLSIMVIFLFLSERSIESSRWQ